METDKSDLEHQKSTLEFSCEVLGKRKNQILDEGRAAERKRDATLRENESLTSENNELKRDANVLKGNIQYMHETVGNLFDEANRAIDTKNKMASDTPDDLRLIDKYFPEVRDMLPAIRECEEVRLTESSIKVLLDKKEHGVNRLSLYDPVKKENVDVAGESLHIKRDQSDNKFHLFVSGSRVFQWIKQKWESLKQTVKRGFRPKF